MIKTQAEYENSQRVLRGYEEAMVKQRQMLLDGGSTEQEVNSVLEPSISFMQGIKHDIAFYEKLHAGKLRKFTGIKSVQELANLLVVLRMARGYNRKRFAKVAGVVPSLVTKDEVNEYHDARAGKIDGVLRTLKAEIEITVRFVD